MADATHGHYYVPHGSHWPIVGSFGLFFLVAGFAAMLNDSSMGGFFMVLGFAVLVFMMFGWFGTVIRESQAGTYNDQVDMSFRWGMGWFIFSEVMFFAAFFGALYYARIFSVPWLGGDGAGASTQSVLWPAYEAAWPTNGPDGIGGDFGVMGAWGLPAINTLLLLSSGVTITIAHWALKYEQRSKLCWWLGATVVLGVLFLILQVAEYAHAINELGLTLGSGVYGSTFFMLTGFHGAHVTIGAIMLAVILLRSIKGHFTPKQHFAFEAVAWYWHFVDVVWVCLFFFVYIF